MVVIVNHRFAIVKYSNQYLTHSRRATKMTGEHHSEQNTTDAFIGGHIRDNARDA